MPCWSCATRSGRRDAHFTLTVVNPPPTKNRPVVSGSNALSGVVGEVGAQTGSVELKDARFGSGLEFTCSIGGVAVKVTATQNGALAFDFTADALNALAEGSYDILVCCAGNSGNYAVSATNVGTLTIDAPIEEPEPTTWSIPAAFRATKGFSYQLAQAQPEGHELPKLIFTRSNKKAATDDKGVLTAKTTGKLTIKAISASGANM